MDISLTLYLRICYLLFCFFPMGVVLRVKSSTTRSTGIFPLALVRPVMALGIPYFMFWGGVFPFAYKYSFWNMAVIIILSIFCTLGIECMISFMIYKKVSFVNNLQKITANRFGMLCILVLGVLVEELIYRAMAFELLQQIGIPLYGVIFITAFIYSLNHVFLGLWTMVIKFWWGIVIGYAFAISGNFFIPILIHLVNNIIIYRLSIEQSRIE